MMMSIRSIYVIGLLGCLYLGTIGDVQAQRKRAVKKKTHPKEEREMAPFGAIRARGSTVVYLTQGSPQKVEVQAPAAVLKKFQTEVKDGRLTMGVSGKVKYKGKPIVYITVESLKSIVVAGSGRFVSKAPFKAEDLILSISGSGEINFHVDAEKIRAKISGSGSMKLQGKSEELYARITGSGGIDALDLQLTSCNVGILGSGTCRAYVNTLLYARISGSGNVYYKGEVDNITSNVSGNGDVIRLKK